ncbi:MAG: SURF1 family protein [Candidatus Promineifilaceae bacterium]
MRLALNAHLGESAAGLLRLTFGRRRRWLSLGVLTGMVLLARLGFWQLDRLEQRRAANALLREQLAAPALVLNGAALPAALEALGGRLAEVSGQFDASAEMVLALQSWQGRPGIHLLTPLRINGGRQAILVDRGWAPDAAAGAAELAAYERAGGAQVTGILRPGASAAGPRDPDTPDDVWYRVDIAGIQEQLPYPLLPVYLRQLPAEEIQESPPFRAEREVDLSEGPHLGYAAQWFTFAALLPAGYVVLLQRNAKEQDLGGRD